MSFVRIAAGRKLKSLIRDAGLRFIPAVFKPMLRRRVLGKPLNPDYPFEPELKILRLLVTPGRAFVDVGAHVGMYSYMVEDILGPELLYLFEPMPPLYTALCHGFKGAHVSPCALSSTTGKSTLYTPHIDGEKDLARASLRSDNPEPGKTGTDLVNVTTVSLDEFVVTQRVPRVGFIKIDVEGHELEVLSGAGAVLAGMRPVVQVEIEQRHHADPIEQVFEKFESHGYRGYYLDRVSLQLKPLNTYRVAEMQDMALHRQGIYYPYINNFLFFPVEDETTMAGRCNAYLEKEKN